LEQCIQSVDNKELIRKAISKGWELDKFIEEAAQIEGTNLQMKEMKIEENGAVYKVQNRWASSSVMMESTIATCSV
jgi:hypothetical protein